jgi:hypothetical protein
LYRSKQSQGQVHYALLAHLFAADAEPFGAAAVDAVATAAAARCGSGTDCAIVAAAEQLVDIEVAAPPPRLLIALSALRAAPPLLQAALPPPAAAAVVAATAPAAACVRPSGRKPARAMMAAKATPSSSRAVCPLSGSVTRRASGSTPCSRAASAIDGSSRSAAEATSSVGALQTNANGHTWARASSSLDDKCTIAAVCALTQEETIPMTKWFP